MTTPILTVANQLTLLRMALSPFLVLAVLWHEFTWALVIFVVAGVSDLLDGLIARLGHQKTTLGAMLDPVADKVLLSSSFIVLTWGSGLDPRIPVWLTVITLSRDAIIVVSVTVINLTVGRRIFYPSFLGKGTTVAQIVTAGVVLLLNALGTPQAFVIWLFYATVTLTVASAVHYVHLASTGRGTSELP
jgi:cardiolipin synthase (CMP-forming)